MPPPKLKLYVDTVSPFAYVAYYILRHDPVFSKCEVTFVPILLGGVMKACGNTAPINIKNKDKWIEVERLRWAKAFNIPMKPDAPEGFPPKTLTMMRALCALTALHPGDEAQKPLTDCLDALYEAYWVHHKKTDEKDVLAQLLSDVLGKQEAEKGMHLIIGNDGDQADKYAVLEMAGKEGKAILSKNTDVAFADGAFGLPWFVATNSKSETEKFWGVDHLAQVTQHLGLEKPKMGGWTSLL
ncbi:gstk1-1 [Hyphodiscus hymeniophilus]|uniref:Glutathione S-transferase kappa n=1 Tax=Hyphodiscus hymeniophilus TaxID=353542 RepID=A0A9P6VP91_9HELO|nr:gstk1-1 [Hyphodiscus hymeniophilus]